MTASVKELSDILGKTPTGDQLYQFFKQLKKIKREYKEHGSLNHVTNINAINSMAELRIQVRQQ